MSKKPVIPLFLVATEACTFRFYAETAAAARDYFESCGFIVIRVDEGPPGKTPNGSSDNATEARLS